MSTVQLLNLYIITEQEQSGEREKQRNLSLPLLFSLTSVSFLLFSTALECLSGAACSTLLQFGSALGLFTVYMVHLNSTFQISRCSSKCVSWISQIQIMRHESVCEPMPEHCDCICVYLLFDTFVQCFILHATMHSHAQ